MNTCSKSVYMGFLRQVIYLIVMTIIVVSFWKIGDVYKNSAVMENGIFENMQMIVLALTALIFGVNAVVNQNYRPLLLLMSMMMLAASIREQDAFFDELVPAIGWKWAWIFPFIGIANCIRKRSLLKEQITHFLSSHCFHMLMTAAIIMIPIAQCLGHRSFLVDLMNNDMYDAVLIRRILEETVELIAYFMILLAAVESFFSFRQTRN